VRILSVPFKVDGGAHVLVVGRVVHPASARSVLLLDRGLYLQLLLVAVVEALLARPAPVLRLPRGLHVHASAALLFSEVAGPVLLGRGREGGTVEHLVVDALASAGIISVALGLPRLLRRVDLLLRADLRHEDVAVGLGEFEPVLIVVREHLYY
jgi:hypothetical protein